MSEFRDVGVCSIATMGNASHDAYFVRATAVGTLDEILPEDVFFDYMCDQSNEQHLEPNGTNGLRIKATALGDGLTGAGTAKLSVDVAGLTETTTLAPTDELIVDTAAGLRRVDISVISVSAQEAVVDTVADLRALGLAEQYDRVFVKGHSADFDGGEGTFALLGTGAATGDIDSAGDDDDGWHVVVTASGDIYGRLDDTIRPAHFGAPAYEDDAAAAAGSDQFAEVQRSVDLWVNPNTFSNGWGFRGDNPTSLKFEAPSGFYRCESTLEMALESGGAFDDYVPGNMRWYGSVWVPYATEQIGIQIRTNRNAGKPYMYVKAFKQRAGNDNAYFVSQNWPPIARNTSRYRAWAATTLYWRHERIIHQHANGSVYLYLIETAENGPYSGTTSVTAPTHTTGTVTDGGVDLRCIGQTQQSTADGGETWNQKLRKSRDWGIHVRSCWEQKDIHWEADGFTVGLAAVPNNSGAIGWSDFTMHQCHACKHAVLLVDYGLEQRVANITERNAITGQPVGYRAYTHDTPQVYDWNGSSWNPDSDPGAGWANDNQFHLGVVVPKPSSAASVTSADSTYGVVIDTWEKDNHSPNNNTFHGLALENIVNDPDVAECVQWLLASGDANEMYCRDDTPAVHGRLFVAFDNDYRRGINDPTRYPSDWQDSSPHRNILHVDRAGVIYASRDRSYRTSWNNARWNVVRENPGDVGESPVSTLDVPSIRQSGIFSGADRFYSDKLCTWYYATTNHYDYVKLSSNYSSTSDIARYHPEDDSFSFSIQYPLSFIVDLPDNFEGLARLLVNVILADPSYDAVALGNVNARHWTMVRLLDENNLPIETSGTPTSFTREPCWPMTTATASANFVRWQKGPFTFKDNVLALVPAAHVRRMVVCIAGPRIQGITARVLGDNNARILPCHYDSRMSQEIHIQVPPEKGIFSAPTIVKLINDPAKSYRLDETDTTRQVYATSGEDTVVNPGATDPNVWVHDGAAQGSAEIFEWDGAALQSIATNAYYTEPDDWSIVGVGNVSDGNLGATPTVNFSNGDRSGVLDDNCTPTFVPPATPGTWITWTVAQDGIGGRSITWSSVPLATGGLEPVIDTAPNGVTSVRLFWTGTDYKRESAWA